LGSEINQRKKDLGAFYTPSHLAESITSNAIESYLLQNLNVIYQNNFKSLNKIWKNGNPKLIRHIDKISKSLRVLDGSAGNGEFLISAFNKIKEIRERVSYILDKNSTRSIDIELEILNFNIFGMEIDPETLSICHKRMLSILTNKRLNETTTILNLNVLEGNYLESDSSNWENFPRKKKGFDIILGNPPWGGKLTKAQKDHYHDRFSIKSPKRNLNTFSLFVYQTTRLLDPNQGILAFFLPKNIVRSNQYTFLREHILNHYKIRRYTSYGLFKDVTQEFVSIIAQCANQIPEEHLILIDETKLIPQSVYKTNIDFIFTKTYDPKSMKILQLIKENSSLLSKYLNVYRGEELSKLGSVMFCPHCSKWVQLSSRKTEITCPQCLMALHTLNLKTLNLIQRRADTKHSQPILTGEDFDHFIVKKYHYIDPTVDFRSKKNVQIYQAPKLVLQKIKRYPCAAFDSNGYWTTQNVYNLLLKPKYAEKVEILYYILAVLNSSLYRWYYEAQFNLGSNYTNAISILNLKRLLIKNPVNSDPRYFRIVEKSKKIVNSLSELSDKTMNELNELVLEYYHCTDYSSIFTQKSLNL
jgi:hypothetical protein